MPGLQTILNRLNTAFATEVERLADRRNAFAPGQPFNAQTFVQAGIVEEGETRLLALLRDYMEQVPESFREVFRSIIYYALSTHPPTSITFAWAPGYDYEITMWHVPDTSETRGGITVLLKSTYSKE
jgi:hypothetical protein